jgi:CHAD domain-containing protein
VNHELQQDRADARGVRDILCAFIAAATDALGGRRVSDAAIHEARKAVKRARAALRLMRGALPQSSYRRENAALREASRPLSAVRDARVLLDSLDRLEKLYGAAARHSITPEFRRALARRRSAARRVSSRTLRSELLGVARRLAARKIKSHGWQEIGVGLERIYGQGRKALQRAQSAPTPEHLHEWRKQTKYLWHQLQILEPLWPGPIGELADQAHKLSDYLGDDHDLAVLRERVVADAPEFGDSGNGALLALIDRCQARLRHKAFLLGTRIFEEKPRRFAQRFAHYWRRWQREAKARDDLKAC